MEMTPSWEDTDRFSRRHIGPGEAAEQGMLKEIGFSSLQRLRESVVPDSILISGELDLPLAATEREAMAELRQIAQSNQLLRSLIGQGYYDCWVPPVIQRNILENPGWYTQYTPYQAEIAQGRLEALLNFQTLVTDLTAMEIANASLLDEATAAAEAMSLSASVRAKPACDQFFVDRNCHPQTIAVVEGRALPLGWKVVVEDPEKISLDGSFFGALLQYPGTDGTVRDYASWVERAHREKILVSVATDLLSLTLLTPPGEWGADIVVGSTQRFGVPMGYGGPHAAFFATRLEHQRRIPGRIVGVSKDRDGRPAIRLTLQTREQHIRREKATSNICTAQVLLAVMAGMYAVYHGPEGLKQIAARVHSLALLLREGLRKLGFSIGESAFFDTLKIPLTRPKGELLKLATERGMNFRNYRDENAIGISLDELSDEKEVEHILEVFSHGRLPFSLPSLQSNVRSPITGALLRKSAYLKHPVFHQHRSESEMLRYIRSLEAKDLSLTHSMIPLGSCTMKLNATAEMLPISWPEFAKLHPFAPVEQTRGYQRLFADLEKWLAELTGFAAVSLQPNSGAQGEYAGLLVIRRYHEARGQGHRSICLIPRSAHGTNPASAVMAGLTVVSVECDAQGNVDRGDLKKKAEQHASHLAALMITYPSTHGVFETGIRELCDTVHRYGGQIYMDGANMNAQVGVSRPGDYGPDVCHLNLHKTFCIPHGGGGPGMGPIAVAAHLAPFLPGHPEVKTGGEQGVLPVSAAPWGSAGILPIPWMYIRMMGQSGLERATDMAVLNANYIARRLDPYFPVLFKGEKGLVAHECILDLREAKRRADVEVEDIAKRLMDFGFHAPTISWPVPGTMMIEPTESESKEELDRFIEAMILIHGEIEAIRQGKFDRKDNPLKNAPHTAHDLAQDTWSHPYSRQQAVFPAPWVAKRKFWPSVSRIDNVYGDRNLFCTCPSDW